MGPSTRRAWSTVALAAAIALACAGGRGEAGRRGPDLGAPRRHVILFVGDGMHLAHEVAASRYLTGRDDGLVFHDPGRFDWSGHAATWDVTTYDALRTLAPGGGVRPPWSEGVFEPAVGYDVARGGAVPYPRLAAEPGYATATVDAYFLASVNGWVPATDSASAATALSTGRKTEQGRVAWRPGAGGPLTTIAEEVRARRGAAIGIVSTVPFTHATPAAFVAHSASRSAYAAIGAEIVRATRPEVIIGGGWPFDPDHGGTSHAFLAQAEYEALASGGTEYVLVERAPGQPGGPRLLAAAAALPAGGKLLGLFGATTSGGAFEAPIPTGDPANLVSVATRENPTLADATEAALRVLTRDPGGFFVVIEQGDIDWANHAGDLRRMIGDVWDLDGAVSAAVAFVDRPGDDVTWENTLLLVTADHGNNYLRFGPGPALGRGVLPATDARGVPSDPAQYVLAPGFSSSWGHTNELVSVYAKGAAARALLDARAGTWYPAPRVVDNTQLHEVMAEFLGL